MTTQPVGWIDEDRFFMVSERHDSSDPSGVRQVRFVLQAPEVEMTIPDLPDAIILPPQDTSTTPFGDYPGGPDSEDFPESEDCCDEPGVDIEEGVEPVPEEIVSESPSDPVLYPLAFVGWSGIDPLASISGGFTAVAEEHDADWGSTSLAVAQLGAFATLLAQGHFAGSSFPDSFGWQLSTYRVRYSSGDNGGSLGIVFQIGSTIFVAVWTTPSGNEPPWAPPTAVDGVVASGTAQAGTTTTIDLAVGDLQDEFFYSGMDIVIIAGTGAGQSPVAISAYNETLNQITVATPWGTAPDATSVYLIYDGAGFTNVVNHNHSDGLRNFSLFKNGPAAVSDVAFNDVTDVAEPFGISVANAQASVSFDDQFQPAHMAIIMSVTP